jgi:two-component sensor histidine kinase
MCSNIPASLAYGVYSSQLIRYARASSNYSDFLKRHLHLRNRLLDQGYKQIRLIRSLKKFIFRYQDLVELVLLWAQLTKIYPPLPTSVQPISIAKTLLIVPTKNERNPPLFTGKLLIIFQNILRNTTQVIIRHRVKILFSVISSLLKLWNGKSENRQKWKGSSSLHR